MPHPLSITIRRATIQDVPLVAPLFNAHRIFHNQPSDLHGGVEFLAERLRLSESVLFVVEYGIDQVVGFTQLYPAFTSLGLRRLWILNDLFVAPEARRLGIASALLEMARRHGLETGVAALILTTGTENVQAQATYEAHGWKRDERYFTYELNL